MNFEPAAKWSLVERVSEEDATKHPVTLEPTWNTQLRRGKIVKVGGVADISNVAEFVGRVFIYDQVEVYEVTVDGKQYDMVHEDNYVGSYLVEE